MNRVKKPLVLSLLQYPSGHHVAAWRHPDTDPKANISVDSYIASARAAEAAGFDITFIADRLGIPAGPLEATRRVDEWSHGFEALTLAAAVAATTQRIGIVVTASTTFNEPYTLARQLASLDLISGGRLGWNIVTSGLSSEATNFNPTEFRHDKRYARAEEFIAAVRALWGSW
ncbi:LLM class flavin-dependent oxidoreductase, partial [Raoultella sp. Ech2A]